MSFAIHLTPAQEKAASNILEALKSGEFVVLEGAAGSGNSSVLHWVRAKVGGALIGAREFLQLHSPGRGLAVEERFTKLVEKRLATHDVVLVDDFKLILDRVEKDHTRAHLLDMTLVSILSEARDQEKKLVFGLNKEVAWPLRWRAL